MRIPAEPDKFKALREASKGKPRRPRKVAELPARVRLIFVEDLVANGYGSRRTVWRMVKSRQLPKPFKYGNRAAWRQATLDAHLDKKQTVPSTGKAG